MKRIGVDQESYDRWRKYGEKFRQELKVTEYHDQILSAEKDWLLEEDAKIKLEKYKIWNNLVMERQSIMNEENRVIQSKLNQEKKLTKKQEVIIGNRLINIQHLGMNQKTKLAKEIKWKCENDNNFPTMDDCINVCMDMVRNGRWMKPVGMK